jgi:hypothetical protein
MVALCLEMLGLIPVGALWRRAATSWNGAHAGDTWSVDVPSEVRTK